MTTFSPRSGRRIGTSRAARVLTRVRSAATLTAFSAFSMLFFLGASVQPVFTVPLITIESAMEWNAFVQAGAGTLMALPAHRRAELLADAMHDDAVRPDDGLAGETVADGGQGFGIPLDAFLAGLATNGAAPIGEEPLLPEIVDPFAADLSLVSFAATLAVAADSLDIPPSDTTARSTFLPPRPRPSPVAQPFPERISTLYGQPTRGIQRIVTVDSTKNEVLIREVINGRDVRIPYRMSLEDYIRGR